MLNTSLYDDAIKASYGKLVQESCATTFFTKLYTAILRYIALKNLVRRYKVLNCMKILLQYCIQDSFAIKQFFELCGNILQLIVMVNLAQQNEVLNCMAIMYSRTLRNEIRLLNYLAICCSKSHSRILCNEIKEFKKRREFPKKIHLSNFHSSLSTRARKLLSTAVSLMTSRSC